MLILWCLILVCAISVKCQVNQDITLDFLQTAILHGYQPEEHFVTTSDGYILRLFRISHGLNDNYQEGRRAVLIQHGLIELSDVFIIRGTMLSPGFYLANNGYDVWFSNSRGCRYSRNHTTLDPNRDPEFWDFSFPDLLPDHKANIEFILNHTGLDSISLWGYSGGASSIFTGLSLDNEWFIGRVNLYLSIEPLLIVRNIFGLSRIGFNSSLPWELLRRLRIYEAPLPLDAVSRNTQTIICQMFEIL